MNAKSKIILIAIIILGLGIRLYNFQSPNRPIFDETFFAQFAADYSLGQPHFDIHPPLGKMIFSLPLFFTAKENRQTNFLDPTPSAKNGFYRATNSPYDNFPYIPLRLISVFFGGLIILAAFWLTKNLAGERAGLWAAFLIAIESGFIEINRLIILDGPMIAFGLIALAIFFRSSHCEEHGDAAIPRDSSSPPPIGGWRIRMTDWLAGIFWGLAISVKLNAAIFLAPIIIAKFLTKNREEKKIFNRRLLIFFGSGLLTLGFFWIILNNLWISPTQWIEHYQFFLPELINNNFLEKISLAAGWLQPIILFIGSGFLMVNFALNGYLSIGGTHAASSPWYAWLIGQKPINWGSNAFLINHFIQFLVLISLIWLAIKLIKKPTQKQVLYGASKIKWSEMKPEIILAGGYILSFLPFIMVNRPTFLYQYLPTYSFGLILVGITIEKILSKMTPNKKPARGGSALGGKIVTTGLVIICLISFVLTMPYIYN
ncbi:MAG: phospholipid carrier-dependent glycosyltransferase [bacterium]|nr:phospholipid carrier-dependent glycosyltransferase [bacterium]